MKSLLVGLLVALLGIANSAGAQVATPVPLASPVAVELEPYTSEAYGYQTLVPAGWTDAGQGIFLREQSPDDVAVLAQQTSPLASDAVLEALLPQLTLSEAPEPTGTHQGAALEWTLYQVDVAAAGIEVRVDLALANQAGTTYLVLLQAAPEEYEELHQQVFLPTINAFAPLEPVATPVAYEVEEVMFENGDVTLAGTLTMPPGEGPFPTVVLVSGSGPQDRDESLGAGIALRPFALLADGLTNAGLAVIRYDDRGVGRSTGDFDAATTEDFAADAAAAIDYLLSRDEIDPDQIGVIGHSEGGLVAAMLGARDPELDFIISLAGPAVSGREVLRLQTKLIMEATGATPEEVEAQLVRLDEIIALLDDPNADRAALEELVYEIALLQAQAMSEEDRAALGDLEEFAQVAATQGVETYDSDWFRFFIAYDPALDWAQTTVPVLAIYGGKDLQVDAEQNAPVLEATLAEAGNDDVTVVVLPDANHLFQAAETGSPTEYATLPAEFTPEFLPTIIGWLDEQVEIPD